MRVSSPSWLGHPCTTVRRLCHAAPIMVVVIFIVLMSCHSYLQIADVDVMLRWHLPCTSRRRHHHGGGCIIDAGRGRTIVDVVGRKC